MGKSSRRTAAATEGVSNNNTPASARAKKCKETYKGKNVRRHSSPTSIEFLHTSLDDILYGSGARSRVLKKQQKAAADDGKLKHKAKYFEMIDAQEMMFSNDVENSSEKLNKETAAVVHKSTTTCITSFSNDNCTKKEHSASLLKEYKLYTEATEEFVTPMSIEEFAKSVRPNVVAETLSDDE